MSLDSRRFTILGTRGNGMASLPFPSQSFGKLKDAAGRLLQTPQPGYLQQFNYKTRFAMLGTVGSGKTTIAGCLLLTAQTLSADQPEFYCRVLEHTSGIREATSNLRRGVFPPKTVPTGSIAYESGLLMKWKSTFGEKNVQIPICDIAGEDVQKMIAHFRGGIHMSTGYSYRSAVDLATYVKDSEGFILVVPASRALLGNQQMEKEPDELVGDPDVNLSRILEEIVNYKKTTKGSKIKAIFAIITKWDLLAPFAIQYGMDLYTKGGIREFMHTCFPDTSMALKFWGLENVKFFPSYVQAMRDDNGTIMRWNDGSVRVEVDQRSRKPKYSESSYVELVSQLKNFAS